MRMASQNVAIDRLSRSSRSVKAAGPFGLVCELVTGVCAFGSPVVRSCMREFSTWLVASAAPLKRLACEPLPDASFAASANSRFSDTKSIFPGRQTGAKCSRRTVSRGSNSGSEGWFLVALASTAELGTSQPCPIARSEPASDSLPAERTVKGPSSADDWGAGQPGWPRSNPDVTRGTAIKSGSEMPDASEPACAVARLDCSADEVSSPSGWR